MLNVILRLGFAWGIVTTTTAMVRPGDQVAMAAIGGLLIGIGAWGWSDK